jgi:uncharacterized protein (DUF697 family)
VLIITDLEKPISIASSGGFVMTEREAQAHRTVKKFMYWSMGAGLIPIPAVDLAAIAAIQLKMVSDIAGHYDQRFSKQAGKALIGSLVGAAVPAAGGPALGSAIKVVPIVGQTAGVIATPVVAGASTFAVGKVFIQHFESGGTMLDFDPERMRDYYSEQFEKGKTSSKK